MYIGRDKANTGLIGKKVVNKDTGKICEVVETKLFGAEDSIKPKLTALGLSIGISIYLEDVVKDDCIYKLLEE